MTATPKPPRDFTYIKPMGRRLSEYEAVTCYAQPDPTAFDKEGWFLRTAEGRVAWEQSSTELVHPHWFDFRDPARQWQRTYVRMQAEQERSIERLCQDAARNGAFADIDPVWLETIIARHYRVWSYFEYALFRAFAPAQREALSDTLGNVLCFEAVDRIRHAQAIVIYLMDIEDNVDGFIDKGSKDIWLNDPIYQPLRALAEKLMLETVDWAEVGVVTNLVVDPIVSAIGLSQLVRRFAPFHGDTITPFIVGTVERDRQRNRDWAEELVRMVTGADIPEAEANLIVVQRWIDKWTPLAMAAARALAPLYDRPPLSIVSFDTAMSETLAAHVTHLETLGLKSGLEVLS